MKRFLVAGFVLMGVLVGTGTAGAQGIGGGAKIGVNFASVSGDVDADKSIRTGMVLGGFLTVPRGAMIAFQPEVLYSMQGVKGEEGADEFTAKIDEVQIPLLLRLDAKPGYFLAGPQIGFITRAKIEFQGEFGQQEEDFKDDLKSTDIGFLVGGGVTFNRFLVEARYTWGLTNLNDNDDDDNKSRVFSVLVGVGF